MRKRRGALAAVIAVLGAVLGYASTGSASPSLISIHMGTEPWIGYGRGGVILVEDLAAAAAVANAYAPEHMIVAVEEPDAPLPALENVGEILIGPWTPISAANYAVGRACGDALRQLPSGSMTGRQVITSARRWRRSPPPHTGPVRLARSTARSTSSWRSPNPPVVPP